MLSQESLHTAHADAIPLGQPPLRGASPKRLNQLMHSLLSQPIKHSVGYRRLRSRPHTALWIFGRLLMRSPEAIKGTSQMVSETLALRVGTD